MSEVGNVSHIHHLTSQGSRPFRHSFLFLISCFLRNLNCGGFGSLLPHASQSTYVVPYLSQGKVITCTYAVKYVMHENTYNTHRILLKTVMESKLDCHYTSHPLIILG